MLGLPCSKSFCGLSFVDLLKRGKGEMTRSQVVSPNALIFLQLDDSSTRIYPGDANPGSCHVLENET
jgi:hypothetical protein